MTRKTKTGCALSRRGQIHRALIHLRRKFGPQGWWPRVVQQRAVRRAQCPRFLVKHHAGNRRSWVARTPCDRTFEVAIGAILTQNTAWSNVEKALVCLVERNLFTSRAIARCRFATLERCIRSSGYFRQKAKKLKRFAKFVERELCGDLRRVLDYDDPRRLLLAQWGIGPETSDTILLYGLNHPFFVVDAYTQRFLATLSRNRRWLTTPYEDVRAHCEASLPRSVTGYQEAHALIVAWGKQRRKLSRL